jgi:hypothetical protein
MQYFRSDSSYIYLSAPLAEFYIPMYYFDGTSGNLATDNGSTITTIGIFDVSIKDEKGNSIKDSVFNVPTTITLFVQDSEVKTVDLPGTSGEKCLVLTYYKGSKIMPVDLVKNSDNVAAYFDLITSGKIPQNVPYDKSITLWIKNQSLNGAYLGVSSVLLELILSILYRDRHDLSNKFATVAGKNPNVSMYDYTMSNIRTVCQYTSTFTSVTFEDIDTMITASLNRSRTGEKEDYSPSEALLKL